MRAITLGSKKDKEKGQTTEAFQLQTRISERDSKVQRYWVPRVEFLCPDFVIDARNYSSGRLRMSGDPKSAGIVNQEEGCSSTKEEMVRRERGEIGEREAIGELTFSCEKRQGEENKERTWVGRADVWTGVR